MRHRQVRKEAAQRQLQNIPAQLPEYEGGVTELPYKNSPQGPGNGGQHRPGDPGAAVI